MKCAIQSGVLQEGPVVYTEGDISIAPPAVRAARQHWIDAHARGDECYLPG